MITDRNLEKNGKLIKKVQLLYVDDDKTPCDACDKMKECASIKTLAGDIMVICKDCLTEIVEQF